MKYLMKSLDWVAKLAYLNVLWLLFTLAGAIIFGLFPSTVAMFTIIRRWHIDHDNDVSIRQYFDVFKKEFLKSNQLGLCFLGVSFLMYINIQYMYFYNHGFHEYIKLPLTIVMIIVALMLLYVIPVYVHYQLNIREVFKYALLLMIIHPLYNLGMLVSLACVLVIMLFLPNAIFFFLGSLSAFIIMRTCLFVFKRVAYKQKEYRITETNESNVY